MSRSRPNPLKNTPVEWAPFAAIVCAAFLAYLPALHGTPVWDDSSHMTRADLQPLHGLWRIWFDLGATQQYYPLLHTAFWVEHRLWGDAVLGYHLVNVALHALAACLVFLIVRRLGLPGARLAGLLFALHPLCVEAVAWISEQKSVLSAVFYLSAALVYLEFDRSRRKRHYLTASGLFVLALLSKTVTATLPAALLVVFWYRRGRIEWRRDVRPLIPWFALGASAGLFTAWVEARFIGATGVGFTLSPIQRMLLAGRALWFYGWKLVWPVDLAFFYPRWNVDPSVWWQYLFPAGVLLAAFALFRVARRQRGPLAGFLFFAGTLFPALGFFNIYPFRYSYVADHFAYLASLGILVPLAWAVVTLGQKLKAGHIGTRLLPALLMLVLAGLTWQQAGTFRDEETLYRATLARNPSAWLAHNNLGNLLLALPGRQEEAMEHIQAALRLKPDFWEAHLSMGNALLQQPGRLDEALSEYQIAERLAPESERTQTNLGNALLQAGRPADALAHLQAALRIQPDNAEALNDVGNALAGMPGRLPDAIAAYRAAVRVNPRMPEAHNNLGRALAQVPGGMPEAIDEFQAAIDIRPDYWSAHSNLGNALSQMPGRLPDAIAEYETALRLRPDSAAAHNNLGYALSQMPGRLPDAIAEYRKALQLNARSADAHYNLACALLRVPGGKSDALAEFEATEQLRPSPQLEQAVARLRAEYQSAK